MNPEEMHMNKHSNAGKKKSSEKVPDGLNLEENTKIQIKHHWMSPEKVQRATQICEASIKSCELQKSASTFDSINS